MSFPDLEYRTDPIRETDADAVLLALPPLDKDDSPTLEDWPGLRDALLGTGFTGAPLVVPAGLRARQHEPSRSPSSARALLRAPQPCATRSAPASAPSPASRPSPWPRPPPTPNCGPRRRRVPPWAATASTDTRPKDRSPAPRPCGSTERRTSSRKPSPRCRLRHPLSRWSRTSSRSPRSGSAPPTSPSARRISVADLPVAVEVLDEVDAARRGIRRDPRRRPGFGPSAATRPARLRARWRRAPCRARRARASPSTPAGSR